MLQLTSLNTVDYLASKIQDRTAKIGVVGLGYVGLPLAIAAAEEGFEVFGVDMSTDKVDLLNNGQSYVDDIPDTRLIPLVEKRRLKAFSDCDILAEADVVVICVPTPVNKTHDPDMSYIISATESIAEICHPGMLVILESTTYPGTTLEVVAPRLETGDLIVGVNLFIAFSPERIDPGNKHYGIQNTPKIVGGITSDCSRVAVDFYSSFIDTVKPVSSTTTAETVKLLENTFRAVNIGLANEFAIMCDKMGINVWEVIEAASTKPFGFTPFYPGPGLGGHCIPVDPHYLSWKMKTLDYRARFIEIASEVNKEMPHHVVNRIGDVLNDMRKSIRGANIAVLGVAYKPDIMDVRESPALDVIRLLLEKGASVTYNDPRVPSIRMEHAEYKMFSTPYNTEWLANADCVVILTNHSNYNWQEIVDHSRMIVDTRNATRDYKSNGNVISI